MANETLLISAAFSLAAAIVYGFVGWRLGKRHVSPQASLALRLFSIWWYSLAALSILTVANLSAAWTGVRDIAFYTAGLFLSLLVLCIGLWGMVYYLIFLFSGSTRALGPLTLFYIGYFLLLVYYVIRANPLALEVNRWNLTYDYQNDLAGTPLWAAVLALLFLPQILGALLYLSLVARVEDRSQKYRVLVVSISILLWFLSGAIASGVGLSTQEWWQWLSRFLGIGAAVSILFAYYPPRLVQRSLHVQPVGA